MAQNIKRHPEDAKEIIAETAKALQAIDERIHTLREERKEIVKNFRDSGLSVKALNKAVKSIRDRKKDPALYQEVEIYENLIESIVNPV